MPKKTVSNGMKAHLARAVTTLAGCWLIVRTDGGVFGFTTFDSDLIVEGKLYQSIAGFSATAISSSSTGQVDNLQVLGFFSEDPGGVKERDVKNRLFDYARVYLFFVNWADLTMTPIRMRTGWLGETVVAPNGSFAAELRGLNQALVQELGNFYSPLCRNDLGDHFCKVPILPPPWSQNTRYGAGQYIRARTAPDDATKQAVFIARSTGLSAPTEPAWALSGMTVDYQVTWEAMPAYRQIGAVIQPIDQHRFISTPLSYPASTGMGTKGSIAVINSVSRGTVIEVNDGITTVSISAADDVKKQDALYYIFAVLTGSALNMTYIPLSGPDGYYGIALENHSGLKGNITKTGDFLGAIIIEGFGDQYLDAGGVDWIDGNNTSVKMELKHYEPGTHEVQLYLGMLMPIQVGDRFWYYPGCDKRRDTCLRKFNNINNFRGEPDIPGVDKMLSYPDSA
jgi:hypothetical protein